MIEFCNVHFIERTKRIFQKNASIGEQSYEWNYDDQPNDNHMFLNNYQSLNDEDPADEHYFINDHRLIHNQMPSYENRHKVNKNPFNASFYVEKVEIFVQRYFLKNSNGPRIQS
jgi:hypothetical protein